MKKGKADIISDGDSIICNESQGSLKRCGGIGDILTGIIGTFIYWIQTGMQNQYIKTNSIEDKPNMLAAYCGSVFTRECSLIAFEKYKRSLIAVDIIDKNRICFLYHV